MEPIKIDLTKKETQKLLELLIKEKWTEDEKAELKKFDFKMKGKK